MDWVPRFCFFFLRADQEHVRLYSLGTQHMSTHMCNHKAFMVIREQQRFVAWNTCTHTELTADIGRINNHLHVMIVD